jgi:hypothetical protein
MTQPGNSLYRGKGMIAYLDTAYTEELTKVHKKSIKDGNI